MRIIRPFLLLTLLFFNFHAVAAQELPRGILKTVLPGDTLQTHELILMDYSRIIGRLLSVEEEQLRFELRSGRDTINVPVAQMRVVKLVEDRFESVGRRQTATYAPLPLDDLNYERTALPFAARSQLRIVQLGYVVYERNFGKYFRAGLGTGALISALATAKFRASLTEKVHVGVSFQGILPYAVGDNSGTISDLSAMLTLGDERQFINLGVGRFYNTFEFSTRRADSYRVGVGGRIGGSTHVYAELVSLDSEENTFVIFPTLSIGLQRRMHRWNLGLGSVLVNDDSPLPFPLPYVGYVRYWK